MRNRVMIVLAAVGFAAGSAFSAPRPEMVRVKPIQAPAGPGEAGKRAAAVIEGRSGSQLTGEAVFVQRGDSVSLEMKLENAPPGTHAVHLHEKGDCSAPDAMSAGPHWNPTGQAHGKWGHSPFHRGDIGNIEVGPDGKGSTTLLAASWSVGGKPETDVLGRSVVVHASADDFVTQPTGNAGGRIGCGVVRLSQQPGGAAEVAPDQETRAEVPALNAFHEVIFPLWHEAWPAKNVGMMRDLLPKVQEHVRLVREAELPGILRDRKGDWDRGVKALVETAERYAKAAASGDDKALIDAVEDLHSRFEGLVRVVRPATKELDAYHVELYRVYHKLMPAKDVEGVRAASEEMVKRCGALVAAPVPKRLASREAELRAELKDLCAATERLREVARGSDVDAVSAAVEAVHAQYQKAEKLFE